MAYFKEIEFEISPEPGAPEVPATKRVIDEEALVEVIQEIKEEFERIKIGRSDLVPYAIDNGSFGSPVGNQLKTLESSPSLEAIRGFIQLATQDLGAKASAHFATMLTPLVKEVPNE